MFTEAQRLTRESWLDASDEDRISILCPSCDASIDLRPDRRSIACRACGVILLAPRDDVAPHNGPHSDKNSPPRPSIPSLAWLIV